MVLARPLQPADREVNKECKHVTFLSEEILRSRFPIGSTVDVAVIERCTNFFLGLNAGKWLTIRMNEIAKHAAASAAEESRLTDDNGCSSSSLEMLLEGTGLELALTNEPPPSDRQYLFEHYSLSGNGGLSGQTVLYNSEASSPSGGTAQTKVDVRAQSNL